MLRDHATLAIEDGDRQAVIHGILQRVLGRGGLRRELALGAIGSMGVKVIGKLMALGVMIFLARTLGPDGYGIYVFALTSIGLIGMPATAGMPMLLLREIAAYQAREQWPLMKGLLLRANLFSSGFSLVLLITGGAVLLLFGDRLEDDRLATFAWALLLLPPTVLGSLRSGALRGLRRIVLGLLPVHLVQPAVHASLLSVVVLTGGTAWVTPQSAMATLAVAAVVAFAVGAVLLWRHLPAPLHGVRPAYDMRRWARSVPILSTLVGVSFINHHADVLMLGWLANAEAVGIYKVVVQIVMVVPFGLMILNQVQGPHFSRMYAGGERQRLQRLVTVTSRLALLTAIPAVGVLLLFGDRILELIFGEPYGEGYVALTILCAGQLVNAGTGSVRLLANMTGHEHEALVAFAISAACNVLMNAALIPIFGMEGAALSTATSIIVWNLILSRRVRIRTGISTTALPLP